MSSASIEKKNESQDVVIAQNILESISKLSKLYKLYNPNNEIIKKQMSALLEITQRFFSQYEELRFRITPTEIIYAGKPIYENPDHSTSFAFNLFKDGIRKVTIKRGVTEKELVQFLTILGSQAKTDDNRYEDLSTMLWKADFKNITYTCAKGFKAINTEKANGMQDSYASPEFTYARHIMSFLPQIDDFTTNKSPLEQSAAGKAQSEFIFFQSLMGSGEEKFDTTHLSSATIGDSGSGSGSGENRGVRETENAECFDINIDGENKQQKQKELSEAELSGQNIRKLLQVIDSIEEGAVSQVLPEKEVQEAIEKELSEQNYRLLVFNITKSLITLLTNSFQKSQEVIEGITHILEVTARAGDILLYLKILENIYPLFKRDNGLPHQTKEQLYQMLLNETKDEKLILLISSFSAENINYISNIDYLYRVTKKSLFDCLLEIIVKTEDEDIISKIENILIILSNGKVEVFSSRLYDRRIPVVKSMLKCLARIGNEEAIEALSKVSKHPSEEIKLFLIRVLKIRKGPAYRKALMEALSDKHEKVRLEALRQITFEKDSSFAGKLKSIIESDEFVTLSLEEKIATTKAFASSDRDAAEDILIKMISKKSLFHRDEINQIKIAAAEGLGIVGSQKAKEVLINSLDTSIKPLRETCERILRSMK